MPKRIQRKLIPIEGAGHHSRPKLIEGGRFHGRVIKSAFGSRTPRNARQRVEKCARYRDALREAGIPVLSTEIKIAGSGSRRRIYFIQEHVPGESLLSNTMAAARQGECVKLVNQLLSYTQMIRDYNNSRIYRARLDVKFDNWVVRGVRGSTLALLDLFPPKIEKYRKVSEAVEEGRVESSTARLDSVSALFGIINRAIRIRPEFAEQFLEAGREFARKNHSKTGLGRILKALENTKTLQKAAKSNGKRKDRV